MVVQGRRRPEVRWSFQPDGTIKATTSERPDAVRLWQATNTKARNFRFDVIGTAYKDSPLEPAGPNTWSRACLRHQQDGPRSSWSSASRAAARSPSRRRRRPGAAGHAALSRA